MPCAVAVSNSPIFSPAIIPAILYNPSSSPRIHGPASASASAAPSQSPSATSVAAAAAKGTASSTSTLSFSIQPTKKDSGGSVLKRKRPTRLDIPLTGPHELGLKMTPRGENRLDEVEVEGEGYSVYCKRGRRGCVMEDRYAAVVGLDGDRSQAFFGVFDGHGGAKAAEFAARNLDKNIIAELSSSKRAQEGIENAIKNGYLKTDTDFLKENIGGGVCCVTALMQNGNLVVSNAGDCRAVMSRGGVAEALTSDHQPSRKDERDRIEALGGYVDCYRGVWRIQGSLAVTRGIGDGHFKQWVTAEPETKVFKIKPECEFLILASDGLWDKVSNQEAVDLVRPICVEADVPKPFSACKRLADLSLTRGSMDDVSVMIIQLGHFA